MADTIRQRIVNITKERAQTITRANGFLTDAGLRVEHGPYNGTPADTVPLIRIMSEAADPIVQDDVIRYTWALYVVAVCAAPMTDPLDAAEDALADLKLALFLEDRTLGGLFSENKAVGDITYGRSWTDGPVPGGSFVSAGVEMLFTYFESYGRPDVA